MNDFWPGKREIVEVYQFWSGAFKQIWIASNKTQELFNKRIRPRRSEKSPNMIEMVQTYLIWVERVVLIEKVDIYPHTWSKLSKRNQFGSGRLMQSEHFDAGMRIMSILNKFAKICSGRPKHFRGHYADVLFYDREKFEIFCVNLNCGRLEITPRFYFLF